MSTSGLTVVRGPPPVSAPRHDTRPADSACGGFGPTIMARTTAAAVSPAPARSSEFVPRCTSELTQPLLDCCRVTRWINRNAIAATRNTAVSAMRDWLAANSDANTNTVPAGTTDSNGTHTRNAAQSATNADHHSASPAASRNGVVTGVGACTDWKSFHTLARSPRSADNVSPVGIPPTVVLGYSTIPMVNASATRDTTPPAATDHPTRRVMIDTPWATSANAATRGKKLPSLNSRLKLSTTDSDSTTSAASAYGNNGRTARLPGTPPSSCRGAAWCSTHRRTACRVSPG